MTSNKIFKYIEHGLNTMSQMEELKGDFKADIKFK